jgi:hypothetical protein
MRSETVAVGCDGLPIDYLSLLEAIAFAAGRHRSRPQHAGIERGALSDGHRA